MLTQVQKSRRDPAQPSAQSSRANAALLSDLPYTVGSFVRFLNNVRVAQIFFRIINVC